ncbi:MAG: BlaI/MecI/CopY family transcriptional regulator [Erysipelotrichaceae bacterium]|nr:BlaI/MecI/CopY family transcriptional regulator [Erysipelotrichaceae bacterium]MDY5251221.1 BlaI/MecI/CopY family transcriptional regulator [Erysipelotrichaceae bacterium]
MLSEAEYQLAQIIWQDQPISSKELIIQAHKKYQWKKSTTYTLLKRMIDKQLASNNNGIITMLVDKQLIDHQKTQNLLDQAFDRSLPKLISTYYQGKTITKEEANAILTLIKQFEDEIDN